MTKVFCDICGRPSKRIAETVITYEPKEDNK